MKKTLFAIAAIAALCCASCTKKLEDRVEVLEKKVTALETQVNANVTSIEKLFSAYAKAITITSVAYDEAGFYDVKFSDGNTVRVTKESLVGVKEVSGVLCWTLNGEVLTNNGAAVRVADAAPVFKFVDGKWKVSYDGEVSWSEVTIATKEIAVTLTETAEEYVFTIGDVNITVAKDQIFAIKVTTAANNGFAGDTVEFDYTVSGADADTHVYVTSKGYEYKLDTENQKLYVTVPAAGADAEYIVINAVRNTDGKKSAQYIIIDTEDRYGVLGGIIITDHNPYTEW